MSKILVTGAAGFIGTYVTERLLAQGYDVIALTNSKNLDVQSDRLTVIEADICDEDLAKKVFGATGQCQTVVHLAADIRVPGDGRTIEVNCLGTYYVTELANELGADKLIYLSSVPVIGKPIDVPITEDHPAHPETLYHITKGDCEPGRCAWDEKAYAAYSLSYWKRDATECLSASYA